MINETKILNYVDKMPGLPTTVTKVVELANNIKTSPGELMKVIKVDPVLTAKVLKLINSAYFGLPQKVTSITRAVILLGINTLKNLALSSGVMSLMKVKRKIPDFNIDLFWEHSLGCAVASKILAKKINVPKNFLEEYFIAGLMHDIGKILLIQNIPDEYIEVLKNLKNNKTSIIIEEDELLGINHSQVGALIGKKWDLAERLIEAIGEHHFPELKGDALELKLIVYIANLYCNINGFGFDSIDKKDLPTDEVWEILGISQDECKTLLSSLPEQIDNARVFLQVNK